MDIISLLGGAMGLAFVSGINLYATILAVGFGINSGLIELAPGMEPLAILGDPLILTIAGVMYAAEFFADKVPWVDSAWDTVHTLIRPVGGALLAASAVGTVDPGVKFAVMLLGGGVAFSSHATKASARLLINQSPEPFTNTAASVTEDIVAFAGAWLAMQHPAAMFALVAVALIAIFIIGPKIWRLVRVEFAILATLLGNIFGGKGPAWDRLPDKFRAATPDGFRATETDFCLRAISAKGTTLRRNLLGVLCLHHDRLVFLSRSYFRPQCHEIDLGTVEDAWIETKLLVHRLGVQTEKRQVRFSFLRDRSGRAARVLNAIQARQSARAPAESVGSGAALDGGGAPA